MEVECGYCHKTIQKDAECCIIEDDYSAWFLHPACYDKHVAKYEAKAQAELEEAQKEERKRFTSWNALSRLAQEVSRQEA
jgi:hypothetical protein